MQNEDDLPYRSPTNVSLPVKETVSSFDERELSTLQLVRQRMAESIEGLYKDFNAFEILKDGTTEEAKDKMFRQIAGKQEAYDILHPLLAALDTAIERVNEKYKE